MSWDPKERLRRFVMELENALGNELGSVVLFGSVARGESHEGLSDVNLLVLLEHADRSTLARGAPVAQRWRETAGAVPLIFTPDEWRRSADVFPIELADMQDHRRVLHGPDPVAELEVSPANLRLQLEREIRGKLAFMRRGVFLAADHPADLGRLLLGSAPSIASYLRAVLRLTREKVPSGTPDVARAACARMGLSADPFVDVWRGRDKADAFQPPASYTDGILALLLKTAAFVDSLEER